MKNLVNAIIDAELDAAAFAKQAYESAATPAKRLQNMARNFVALAKVKKMTVGQARKLWVDAYRQLIMLALSKQMHDIQETMDKHLDAQVAASKELGSAVKSVPAIRNVHIKERAMERAGALDKSGVLKDDA